MTSTSAAVRAARRVPRPKRPLAEIVTEFREVARAHGYALAEHGSKKRDYDLIAVPWTKEAKAASTLVRALARVEGVRLRFHTSSQSLLTEGRICKKPHGRLGYVFLLEPFHYARRPGYIDLSVMPRG
jgi:hypothetical protein